MTKPDNIRWTPEENEEIAKRTNAILDKFTDIVRQEAPTTPDGWNAVIHAASELIVATVVGIATKPREMIAVIASDLTRAVDARLGGRETEH
jgi:hypothetical protein